MMIQSRGINRPRLKAIYAILAVLLFVGLFIDLITGFQLLKESKSILWWLAGILLLAIIYLIGECEQNGLMQKMTFLILFTKEHFTYFYYSAW